MGAATTRRPVGRAARSPMIVGAVILGLATVGLGAQLFGRHGRTTAAPGAGTAAADGLYRNVARSLSPLIVSAKELSTLTREAGSGSTPAATVSQVAQRWETNFATSRDLVGRLPTPGGSALADRSRTLYQLGASLYVESARAVPMLVAAADPVARAEALKRVNRLTSLGDHLFDAGTRVLGPGSDGASPVAVTRIPTPEVPDFAAGGLDPGQSGSPSPSSAPYGDRTPQVAPSQWISRHGGEIAEAVAIFDRSVAWVTAPAPAPANDRGLAADALERLAARLGADVPAVREGREGVQILRLALLVQAEALRGPGSGPTGEAVAPARRLRLMAEQLWAVAHDLLVTGKVDRPGRYGLVASGLDPGLLRSGGVFDGRPPQLRPGEDPGTGVPGGLPDISQIAS